MSPDKRRYRSKARPGLEYSVESFCFGYKEAVHSKPKKSRQSVCYGVNFVKVTINKGEVSMVAWVVNVTVASDDAIINS